LIFGGFARGVALPSYTYIIPYFVVFVKGFLKNFSKIFSSATTVSRPPVLLTSPLALILYHISSGLSRGLAKLFEKIY
jgi:hypothetical protein